MKNGIIISLLFVAAGASAQKYVELAKLYYNNSATNHFANSDSSTRVQELGIELTVPILINTSDAFLTGLIYERTQVRLFESEPEENLSILGLKMGFSKKHSDKWSGTYLLIPKLAADLESISGKDFQIGGVVLMKYTKHENLNYRLGAYYNSEFFGPLFVPLFGVYYLSANKKFETNATLPFLFDANYKIHDRIHLGINFFGQVRSYRLSQVPELNGEGYVVKASNDLFSYLKFNLSKGLSLQAKVGHSIGRSYRVYAESEKITLGSILIRVGDDRQQLNTDFANGWIYQAALIYRLIQEK